MSRQTNYTRQTTATRRAAETIRFPQPRTPPQPTLETFETSGNGVGAADVVEVWEKVEELDDQLIELGKQHHALQLQVHQIDKVREHQSQHASATFSKVAELLSTTAAVNEKIKELEGASRVSVRTELDRHRDETLVRQRQFEEEIKRVLNNFKAEVVAIGKENETRYQLLQKGYDELHERIVDLTATQRLVREDHIRLTAAVDATQKKMDEQRKETTRGWQSILQQVEESVLEVRQQVDTKHEALTKSLGQRVETERSKRHELSNRFEDRLTDGAKDTAEKLQLAMEECRRDVTQLREKVSHGLRVDEFVSSIEKKIAIMDTATISNTHHIETDRAKVAQLTTTLVESVTRLERTSETHTSSFTVSLQETIKKLESDAERRHRKLVESTHQALADISKATDGTPAILATMQQDVGHLRESVHAHQIAIEALRIDGSLDSAFAEVKDWLQDLERRTMSRTEIEESLLSIQTQLAAMKHASHSTEMLLGQRIESQRVALEHDYSMHSTTNRTSNGKR